MRDVRKEGMREETIGGRIKETRIWSKRRKTPTRGITTAWLSPSGRKLKQSPGPKTAPGAGRPASPGARAHLERRGKDLPPLSPRKYTLGDSPETSSKSICKKFLEPSAKSRILILAATEPDLGSTKDLLILSTSLPRTPRTR